MNEHKYEVLATQLRNSIRSGEYAVGTKLPSENELVNQTGYSRQTIRQAMSILEREGLTNRVRGSGTYVKSETITKHTPTHNIAVVTTSIRAYIFNDILDGICDVLSLHSYAPILYATAGRVENERNVLMQLLEKPVDGIIIQGAKTALPSPNIDIYNRLSELNIPLVFINSYHPSVKASIYVSADDQSGGEIACRYLVERGHKNIACILKGDDMIGMRRYAGYINELVKANLSVQDDYVIWFTTETQNCFMDTYLISTLRKCTSVICYNDEIAINLISLLETNGIKIPEQMEIVSFDHSSIAQMSPVHFLSLEHPKMKLGKIAAEKMVNILSGKSETSVLLPWKIPEDD